MDIHALTLELYQAVESYVKTAFDAVSRRVDDVDQRIKAIPAGPKGDSVTGPTGADGAPGKSAYQFAVERGYPGTELQWLDSLNGAPGKDGESIVGDKGAPGESIKGDPGPPGVDGRDVDPLEVRAMVDEEVARAVALIPKPLDGEAGRPGERGPEGPQGLQGSAGDRGVQGERGEKGAPGVAAYELAVERGYAGTELQWLESLRGPAGQDGKSVAGQPGEAGERGPVGESIRGEPGPPGKAGESVHQDTLFRMVAEQVAAAVAQIPQSDGRDGRDALELEILPGIDESKSYPRGTFAEYRGGTIRAIRNTDPITDGLDKAGWTVSMNGVAEESEETLDEGRTIRRKTVYTSGKQMVREIKTSIVLDRGVWREGAYAKGDHVSWDGSGWIAQAATEAKPGAGPDWRLGTKRGRDGKDGKSFDALPVAREPIRIR